MFDLSFAVLDQQGTALTGDVQSLVTSAVCNFVLTITVGVSCDVRGSGGNLPSLSQVTRAHNKALWSEVSSSLIAGLIW